METFGSTKINHIATRASKHEFLSSPMAYKAKSSVRIEEDKDMETASSYYSKLRRSVYKPSTKYKRLGIGNDSVGAEPDSSPKRGKSSTVSHSSSYYRKRSLK